MKFGDTGAIAPLWSPQLTQPQTQFEGLLLENAAIGTSAKDRLFLLRRRDQKSHRSQNVPRKD